VVRARPHARLKQSVKVISTALILISVLIVVLAPNLVQLMQFLLNNQHRFATNESGDCLGWLPFFLWGE